MKIHIAIHPTCKSLFSLVITAAIFGFTIYFTCSWKDLHTFQVHKRPERANEPRTEWNEELEKEERAAEDRWVKQYGLDQPDGGFWAYPQEERTPEEQQKIDAFVHEVESCLATCTS